MNRINLADTDDVIKNMDTTTSQWFIIYLDCLPGDKAVLAFGEPDGDPTYWPDTAIGIRRNAGRMEYRHDGEIWREFSEGYSGDSGISGYSGDSGVSGYSGEGTSGYSGFSGCSGEGYSGESGESGYSGYSGFSGLSGEASPLSRESFVLSATDITNGYIILVGAADGSAGAKDWVSMFPAGGVLQDYGVDYTAMNDDSNDNLVIIWKASGSVADILSPTYPSTGLVGILEENDKISILY